MNTEENSNKSKRALRIGSVVARYCTYYKIKRDHSNDAGFFIVNVPEAKQYGIGLQIRVKEYVYGFSIHS